MEQPIVNDTKSRHHHETCKIVRAFLVATEPIEIGDEIIWHYPVKMPKKTKKQ